jgi:hypothetical protein
MDFNSIDSIKEQGFIGFKKIGDLFEASSVPPRQKAVRKLGGLKF